MDFHETSSTLRFEYLRAREYSQQQHRIPRLRQRELRQQTRGSEPPHRMQIYLHYQSHLWTADRSVVIVVMNFPGTLSAAHRQKHRPEYGRLVLLQCLPDGQESILFIGQFGIDKELLEFSFTLNGPDSFELRGVEVGYQGVGHGRSRVSVVSAGPV